VQQLIDLPREHPTALPPTAQDEISPGRILSKVFETLDRAHIQYCVLHGYEELPSRIKSDVDCLIDKSVSARDVLRLLHDNRDAIGADVVHCRGRYFVLVGGNPGGAPCFLRLDFAADYDLGGVRYFDGSEILATRQRHGEFWIPAPAVEFAAYLVRTLNRGEVNDERAKRLGNSYRQDPRGSARQLARFWPAADCDLIDAAARSGDWTAVRAQIDRLKSQVRLKAIRRRPIRFVAEKLRAWSGRAARFCRPDGLSVAFLGPDGAGKSSTISALAPALGDVFPRHDLQGFAPGLLNALKKEKRTTDTPHALHPRSLPVSLLRAGYWFAFHAYGYLGIRLKLARSTLLLHDRSFVDILVDQKRYRYGGPMWMLRLLWWLAPKPDLIILLDAAPEVLQRRKQEVPLEVTARQREAYLALVRSLPNGRVVDAGRPFANVVDSVVKLILAHLRGRLSRRFRLPA
jgi:thymidylate kinase